LRGVAISELNPNKTSDYGHAIELQGQPGGVHMGVDAQMVRQSGQRAGIRTHRVVIVGAGFAGLAMGIRLRQMGIEDFVILEQASEAGGTWRDNFYPGCACDVPSVLYSYSFEQNPDWSTSFSGADEIQAYILQCVEKYDLRRHIRFGHAVAEARWDESAAAWTVTDDAGNDYTAQAVVSAVGGLVNPAIPDIPGLGNFKGRVVHTARWDRALDLAGKRVAVIGTGASAVQLIPAIQPQVGRLTVFQRTAHWVLPKPDFAMPPLVRGAFRRIPLLQRAVRTGVFALTDAVMGPAIVYDTPLNRLMERVGRQHIAAHIKDPALRRKVTPTFRFGCKRMLVCNDYYPALAQPNVEVCTDAIRAVDATGIVTADGRHHDVDIIALATGYRLDIARAPFEVHGRHGVTLADAWSGPGARAYRGVAVAGFPNWFVLMGPNTGPGHTSVLVYTEAQVNYTAQAISRLVSGDARVIAVKPAAQQRYGEFLKKRLKNTNWSSGCTSWYLDEHGENHAMYPGLVSEYVLGIRRFKDVDYDIVRDKRMATSRGASR
jgi:cation diffusion facilitator CzcD-associated flavoprotein CzcO